jgi:hypothetical protein
MKIFEKKEHAVLIISTTLVVTFTSKFFDDIHKYMVMSIITMTILCFKTIYIEEKFYNDVIFGFLIVSLNLLIYLFHGKLIQMEPVLNGIMMVFVASYWGICLQRKDSGQSKD